MTKQRRQQERARRARPPLDPALLETAALRYVERFQTTRARLVRHLEAKLRQRGWAGEGAPDLPALADRLATRGYIDEAAFADARTRGMKARGLGARRIRDQLRADGALASGTDTGAAEVDETEAEALARQFARRRRFGPYGPETGDPRTRARQMAAMLRAGHAPQIARRILNCPPEDDDALVDCG